MRVCHNYCKINLNLYIFVINKNNMIVAIILGFIISSLVCDVYVYNRILVKNKIAPIYRGLFITYWGVIYLFFLLSILINRLEVSENVELYTRVFMWSLYALLISVFPKYIMTVFLVISDFISLVLKRKIRVLNYIGAAISLLVVIAFIHGTTLGRSQIEVKRLSVVSEKIPASFVGYKVAFFSDLHLGTLVNKPKMVERLVDEINNQNVNLVINGGDVVHQSYKEITPEVLDIFNRIEAEDGVLSVLGNHDLGYYFPDSVALPKNLNISLLVNDFKSINHGWLRDNSTYIHRGDDSISITGHTYPRELKGLAHMSDMDMIDVSPAYDGVDSSSFNITVAHDPQLWNRILENNIGDVTLSGHVHAMQFKIKLGNMVFSPASLLYDRWSGEYREGERMLYINDGIGCVVLPMRIGVKPELTIIELKTREK